MTLPSSRLAILTPMAAATARPWPRTAAEAKRRAAELNRQARAVRPIEEQHRRAWTHEEIEQLVQESRRISQIVQEENRRGAPPKRTTAAAAALPAERSELCESTCFAEGSDQCDRMTCFAKRLGADARRVASFRPVVDLREVYAARNRGGAR